MFLMIFLWCSIGRHGILWGEEEKVKKITLTLRMKP